VGRVVLVTGVSSDLGGRFARRLGTDPAVERVIGVDVVPPPGDLGSVAFVRADIRNPVIAKVIAGQEVDTVVHLSVRPGGTGGRSSVKEHNVIGTMQLLAACQKAPSLERLVVRSSAAVYGSSSRDPAMFTEDMAAKRQPRSGFAKDVLEVEGYVRGFARRRPDVSVTMLRAANLVGRHERSPLLDYFRLPLVPTPLGFDARLQFLHEDDFLGALGLATVDGVHGTFNLAGDGVLTLSQAVRRLGRPNLPVPTVALGSLGGILKQAGLPAPSRELSEFLCFGRGLDTHRMRHVLGYEPRHTSESAFAEFAATVSPGVLALPRPVPPLAETVGGGHG
jgi:UDP-glucose 4-epimerase